MDSPITYRILRVLLIQALLIPLCLTSELKAELTTAQPDSTVVEQTDAKLAADSLESLARKYIGFRYKYGAAGPTAFDCSGFTQYIYGLFGYHLTRSASSQATEGRAVTGALSDLQKGDILIFGARNHPERPGHVGIFLDMDSTNNSFTFIHAANKSVKISNSNESYYKKRFLGVRRILPDFCKECDGKDTTENNLTGKQIVPPVLQLNDSTYRLILISDDGNWVFVGTNGELQQPDSTTSIVLNAGKWHEYVPSKVRLPNMSKQPVRQSTTEKTTQYYTIKKGDTLSSIARKYNTSIKQLCTMNNIKENSVLHIGDKIRVQ